MRLFHFTSTTHLPHILADGFLKLTESNLSLTDTDVSVVWLLDTEDVREYAHGLEGSAVDKTEIGIEVDVVAVKWTEWPPVQTMEPYWRGAMLAAGGGMQAADHWYVCPAPIRNVRWRRIWNTHTGQVLWEAGKDGPVPTEIRDGFMTSEEYDQNRLLVHAPRADPTDTFDGIPFHNDGLGPWKCNARTCYQRIQFASHCSRCGHPRSEGVPA